MTYHRPTDHGAVCVHHHIASGCDRCGMMEEIGELMESRDAWKSGVRERQAEIDALEAERDRMREALDVIDGLLHECQPDAIYGANRELLNCRIAIKTARDIARAALAAEQTTREPRVDSGMVEGTARVNRPKIGNDPTVGLPPEAPTIHPPAPTREETKENEYGSERHPRPQEPFRVPRAERRHDEADAPADPQRDVSRGGDSDGASASWQGAIPGADEDRRGDDVGERRDRSRGSVDGRRLIFTPASARHTSPSEEMPATSDPAGNAGRGVCPRCRGTGWMPGHEGDDACAKCHGSGRAGEKPCHDGIQPCAPSPTTTGSIQDKTVAGTAINPSAPSLADRLWGLTNQGMMGLNLARRASSLTMEWQRERARYEIARICTDDWWHRRAGYHVEEWNAAVLSVVLAVIEEKP